MRSRWTAALSAFAMLVGAPQMVAAADDVSSQMEQVQQRLQQMEDRLQATTDQLEAANQRVEEQSSLIEQAGLAETRGASSGLPGFLGEITVGGWVAASYFWNVNGPKDGKTFREGCDDTEFSDFCDDVGVGTFGTNQGINGAFYPLHPDHNSFALDQVWFEVERPIDEEHRAGFRLDTVYGKTGSLLGGPGSYGIGGDDSSIYIHQGYVQYLAPFAGMTFKAGKFATPIGIEVAQTVYNWNITRGNVWTLLQPVDHIGVQVGGPIGDTGLDWMIGGVNGFSPDSADRNDSKSIIWHFGWANEMLNASVNGIWGSEQFFRNNHQSGVVDAIIKVSPTDRLAFYVNADYAWIDASGDPDAWGVAVAGRFGFTDRTGFALRGEWVQDTDRFLGFRNVAVQDFDDFVSSDFGSPTGVEVWGLTGTLDHLLTDHLMIRLEARYDKISKDKGHNSEFFSNGFSFNKRDLGLEDDQITIGAEVVYNFNKFGGE